MSADQPDLGAPGLDYIVCSHPEHLGTDQCYWPRGTVVTWHNASQLPGLHPDDVEAQIASGLVRWSGICGVQFQRVGSASQARLAISSRTIDGPMGVLAEAQLPCHRNASVQCWMHLDDRESWNRGVDLADVVCHEAGHSLGIGHAPQGSPNIMAPIYKRGANPFGPWDAHQAVARYGAPRPKSPGPDAPPAGGGVPFVARFPVVLAGRNRLVTLSGAVAR